MIEWSYNGNAYRVLRYAGRTELQKLQARDGVWRHMEYRAEAVRALIACVCEVSS